MSSRILSELNSNEEYLWVYFDAQHKHILDTMKDTYKANTHAIKGTGIQVSSFHSSYSGFSCTREGVT